MHMAVIIGVQYSLVDPLMAHSAALIAKLVGICLADIADGARYLGEGVKLSEGNGSVKALVSDGH